MNWTVYIIESSDSSYYTGITTDVNRRFNQHLNHKHGAKYFNGRAPIKIVYQEDGHTRSSASKRESQIKALTRAEKLGLLNANKKSS